MRRTVSKLYTSSPKELLHQVGARLRSLKRRPTSEDEIRGISDQLRSRFKVYQTPNLRTITAQEFAQYIHAKIGEIDAQSEGYLNHELDRQRDLSIKFHWGHNHDFGDFRLKGSMGDRHINLLANFVALFPVSVEDLGGKEVFDIGCWTGGTTLLLAQLGCKVFAIEEVKKYAEMSSFLAKSFGIEDQVTIESMSIYNCNSAEFYDRFDMVYFPGVVYHLSDPVLALRTLFNSLKIGGVILIESAGINREEPFCRFDGSLKYGSGTRTRLNRSGWN